VVAAGASFDVEVPRFALGWNATGDVNTNVGIFDVTSLWDFHAGPPVAASRVVRFDGGTVRANAKDQHNFSLGMWQPLGNADFFRFTRGAAAAAGGQGDGIMFHVGFG
jgi:hypothetical protein